MLAHRVNLFDILEKCNQRSKSTSETNLYGLIGVASILEIRVVAQVPMFDLYWCAIMLFMDAFHTLTSHLAIKSELG